MGLDSVKNDNLKSQGNFHKVIEVYCLGVIEFNYMESWSIGFLKFLHMKKKLHSLIIDLESQGHITLLENFFLFQTDRRWGTNHPVKSFPRKTWNSSVLTQNLQRPRSKIGTGASWYEYDFLFTLLNLN